MSEVKTLVPGKLDTSISLYILGGAYPGLSLTLL